MAEAFAAEAPDAQSRMSALPPPGKKAPKSLIFIVDQIIDHSEVQCGVQCQECQDLYQVDIN